MKKYEISNIYGYDKDYKYLKKIINNTLKHEKVKNALSVTILLLSIIFFGWIFINSLKYESNVYYNQNKLIINS